MKHLFAYGSLMFDEVLYSLVTARYKKSHAMLPGYARMPVSGEAFPGLVREQQCVTHGVLILDVSASDLALLDNFEDEYYNRTTVTMSCDGQQVDAQTYVSRKRFRHMLSRLAWSQELFGRNHLDAFLGRYVRQ